MSISYSGLVSVAITSALTEALDLSSIVDAIGVSAYRYNQGLADGSGSGKAQAHWHDQRTLAEGIDEDLDLSALVGPFGDVAFSSLKVILIRVVTSTTGAEITVGPGATNGFTKLAGVLGPNGALPGVNPVDGWEITEDTDDILNIENTGTGSVTYDIVLIGEAAIT